MALFAATEAVCDVCGDKFTFRVGGGQLYASLPQNWFEIRLMTPGAGSLPVTACVCQRHETVNLHELREKVLARSL